MKKILVIVTFTLIFIACKKNYTCECSSDSKTNNYDFTKVKKTDAKAVCNYYNSLYAFDGGSCTLK